MRISDRLKRLLWRVVLACIIIGAIAASILGYVADAKHWNGFVSNICAEVTGNGIAIIIGLWVVDTYNRFNRKQEWLRIRGTVSEIVRMHLSDIGFKAVNAILNALSEFDPDGSHDALLPEQCRSLLREYRQKLALGMIRSLDDVGPTLQNLSLLSYSIDHALESFPDYRRIAEAHTQEFYTDIHFNFMIISDSSPAYLISCDSNKHFVERLIPFHEAAMQLRFRLVYDTDFDSGTVLCDIGFLLASASGLYHWLNTNE